MTTRDQLNQDKVEAILQILESEGIMTNYETEKLQKGRNLQESKELAKGFKKRREK